MSTSMKQLPMTDHALLASLTGGFVAERVHDRIDTGGQTGRVATRSRRRRAISAGPTGAVVAPHLAAHSPRSLTFVPATNVLRTAWSTDAPAGLITVAFAHLIARPPLGQWIPDLNAVMLMTRFTWYFPSLAITASDIAAP